jgi:hypothetical protein
MADYFLPLDAALFDRLRLGLAESRLRCSFEPVRGLCVELLPAARAYAERYHVADEPLPAAVAAGLPFDRAVWRALVGELLLYAAAEIPEFQTAEETLTHLLLAPDAAPDAPRRLWPPVRQAHHGSRELTFGPVAYRPEHAGWNDVGDVARLSGYLASQRPETWSAADLPDGDPEERAEELDYAREWFPALVGLYRRCAENNRVLVTETIY